MGRSARRSGSGRTEAIWIDGGGVLGRKRWRGTDAKAAVRGRRIDS